MPLLSVCRKTQGLIRGRTAPYGFIRIWRHKVNCPAGAREGPLGGVRQIRKKRLRSKAFPAFGAGRAIGASTG